MINRISSLNVQNLYENENKNKKIEKKNISRVDEIKREIENGTYKVDIKKTAKAMAKSLLF